MVCPCCRKPVTLDDSTCPYCLAILRRFGEDESPPRPILTMVGFLLALTPVVLAAILIFNPNQRDTALNVTFAAITLIPALWLVLHFLLQGPSRAFLRGLGYGILTAFVSLFAFAVIGVVLLIFGAFTICSKLPGMG